VLAVACDEADTVLLVLGLNEYVVDAVPVFDMGAERVEHAEAVLVLEAVEVVVLVCVFGILLVVNGDKLKDADAVCVFDGIPEREKVGLDEEVFVGGVLLE
jgi:hypothetical protein